jgi:hypothetical protein
MDSLVSSLLTNVSDTQDGLSIELLLLKLFIEGLLNEEKFIQVLLVLRCLEAAVCIANVIKIILP